MTTPFGPQLIGETEKTLGAILRRILRGSGLTEPQWVTLRLADMLDGTVDANGFVAAVSDRAHFENAAELVEQLTERGLLAESRLTTAGRDTVATIQAQSATTTGPIWNGLPAGDVDAATRVLNEVVTRARAVLV